MEKLISTFFSDKNFVNEDGNLVYQKELKNYFLDFSIGKNNTIVVVFEPFMSDAALADGKRPAWGSKFLLKEGFSVLGIKSKKVDWFRGKDLHTFFRSDTLKNIYANFNQVCFYGGSMGGFAALTFADSYQGAIVITMAPQSTLSSELVPWEKRFTLGKHQDWTGDFIDGKVGSSKAKIVYAFYDPFLLLDAKHIYRLEQNNLVKLPIPFMGHRIPAALQGMGILKQVVLDAINQTLLCSQFKKISKSRRNFAQYWVALGKKQKNYHFKMYALECAIKNSGQSVRDRYYVEALHEIFLISKKENNYIQSMLAAEILESTPRIPRNIRLFVNLAEYYISHNNNRKARLMFNTFDVEFILNSQEIMQEKILALGKLVGSKLVANVREYKKRKEKKGKDN